MRALAIKGTSGPAFVAEPRRADYARTRPGDAEEQQAERVANGMFSNRDTVAGLQGGDPGKGLMLLRPPVTASPSSSPGKPLDTHIRAIMEPRFRWDFGAVRVHANDDAALSATALGAQAYTLGRHIVLGAGHPALSSDAGRRLVAHELTHVVQQATNSRAKLACAPPAAGMVPALGTASTWSGGLPPEDMIIASGDVVPKFTGKVEAAPSQELGRDFTKVTAPDIMIDPVPVGLNEVKYQIGSGRSVQVGFIQTVSSSRRIATYEAPGDNPGDPPLAFERDEATTGPKRDVSMGRYDRASQGFPRAEQPWFLPPVLITPVHKFDTVTAEATTGAPNLFDKPSFTASNTIGRGRLTGFKGTDTFQTSVAAKDSSGPPTEVTHLLKSTWTVPWDVTLGSPMTGQGEEVTTAASKQAPSALTGPTARESAKGYLNFPTVAAAMAVEPADLLPNLAAAKAAGQTESYDNTVAALKAKNPEFEATVTCVKTDSWVGKDEVRFHVGGTNATVSTKLNDRDRATVTFHFNDLADTEAHLWVDIGKAVEDWWWPLSQIAWRPDPKAMGGGKYTVQGKLLR